MCTLPCSIIKAVQREHGWSRPALRLVDCRVGSCRGISEDRKWVVCGPLCSRPLTPNLWPSGYRAPMGRSARGRCGLEAPSRMRSANVAHANRACVCLQTSCHVIRFRSLLVRGNNRGTFEVNRTPFSVNPENAHTIIIGSLIRKPLQLSYAKWAPKLTLSEVVCNTI